MIKKYRTVTFIQDYNLDTDDREYFTNLIDERDETELFKYLMNWETGEGEETDRKPWGNSDRVAYFNEGTQVYALSYNPGLTYAALTAITEDV